MITEAEWLAAKTVIDLELYRSAKGQLRKWRLFGVACCRRAITLAPDPRFDAVADAAEEFADGVLTWDGVKKARRHLTAVRKELGHEFGPDEARHDIVRALNNVTGKVPVSGLGASQPAQFAFAAVARPKFETGARRAEKEQVALARDIFGNPFRPAKLPRLWRTPTAVALAKSMYTSRHFVAMPILADALEEAGCDAAEVLTHCRGPGPHVRGCWVVDLVLGQS